MSDKLTVAILSGGSSTERDVSIKSGNQVYDALDKTKYHVLRYDPKTDIPKLIADAEQIDIALIILHGSYGEDGTVQGMLELMNIPYQGSGPLGSSIAMNKLASKRLYEQAGILVPAYISLQAKNTIHADDCINRLGLPLVIKPVSGGSSIGMDIVNSKESLMDALDTAFAHDTTVLIEKHIRGTEITGGVIGNNELEALPIVEIVPNECHTFFDYQAKYDQGETREICPARIPEYLAQKAKSIAIQSHRALFCDGYSRTDMIISGDDIYVLETNTIPGMTPASLFPQAAKAAGMEFPQLLNRLIALGLARHRSIDKLKCG